MELEWGTLAVRAANFVLWSLVVWRILRRNRPVTALARRLICTVLFLGMLVFVVGAFVPFGFPGEWARPIYTVFTAYAAVTALAMLTSGEPSS